MYGEGEVQREEVCVVSVGRKGRDHSSPRLCSKGYVEKQIYPHSFMQLRYTNIYRGAGTKHT